MFLGAAAVVFLLIISSDVSSTLIKILVFFGCMFTGLLLYVSGIVTKQETRLNKVNTYLKETRSRLANLEDEVEQLNCDSDVSSRTASLASLIPEEATTMKSARTRKN